MTNQTKAIYRDRTIIRDKDRIIVVKRGKPIKRKFNSLLEATDFIDSRIRVQ